MPTSQPETQHDFGAIVSRVLGEMAFLISDDDSPETADAGEWIAGQIGYRGPVSGTIRCWFHPELALELAANLLGLDPDSPEAHDSAEDAVGEFMNVLCGQLVTTWYDQTAVFDLTIPQVTRTSNTGDDEGASLTRLMVSGQPLRCTHVQG